MSQVYSTEPQTTGRVIFETTHGPLEVQLWCRECPATTKFFLQLCLDGFYDNVIFHRIVPNFLIQTGVLRQGSSSSSSSSSSKQTDSTINMEDMEEYRKHFHAHEALDRRSYEVNSRIKFNHRGQVAMALDIEDDHDLAVMQPQFFITLDEASHLDGKHVVFGTVSGPTVFNALRIGRTDVSDETFQPVDLSDAPKVERVKIMENPIHTSIVPSSSSSSSIIIPWNFKNKSNRGSESDKVKKLKRKKRKGVKNLNVLSFGNEFEEDQATTLTKNAPATTGMKSSHDLIESKTLSKEVDKDVQKAIEQGSNLQSENLVSSSNGNSTSNKMGNDEHVDKDAGKKSEEEKHLHKNNGDKVTTTTENDRMGKYVPSRMQVNGGKVPLDDKSTERTGAAPKAATNAGEESKDEKRKSNGTVSGQSLLESRMAKYRQRGGRDKKKRQEDTMTKFLQFQKKIMKESSGGGGGKENGKNKKTQKGGESSSTTNDINAEIPSYHGQILDNDNEDDYVKGDWMKTKFKCRKHMDLDEDGGGSSSNRNRRDGDRDGIGLGGDGRSAIHDYEVVDERNGHEETKKRRHHHHHHQRGNRRHHHNHGSNKLRNFEGEKKGKETQKRRKT